MSFKDKAKEALSGSFVTEGREKIDMADVIRLYGEKGLTIIGADELKDSDGTRFCAFNFKEDDTKFFFGGQVLNELVMENWVEDYEGDYKAMSEALKKEGGVKVKLESRVSKNNKTYTAVTVID